MAVQPLDFNFVAGTTLNPTRTFKDGSGDYFDVYVKLDSSFSVPVLPGGGSGAFTKPNTVKLSVSYIGGEPSVNILSSVIITGAIGALTSIRIDTRNKNIIPYEDISIMLPNGTINSYDFPIEAKTFLQNTNGIVTSSVPYNGAYKYYTLRFRAEDISSNSEKAPTITRDFLLAIENDFTVAKNTVLELIALSQNYINGLVTQMPVPTPVDTTPLPNANEERPSSSVVTEAKGTFLTKAVILNAHVVIDNVINSSENVAEELRTIATENDFDTVEELITEAYLGNVDGDNISEVEDWKKGLSEDCLDKINDLLGIGCQP